MRWARIVSEAVIARAVRLAGTGQQSQQPIAAPLNTQAKLTNELERKALQSLLHSPDLVDWARGQLQPEDFDAPSAQELVAALWEGEDPMALEGNAAGLVRELLAGSPEEYDWHAEAEGAVRKLKIRALERSRRERRTRLGSAQGDDAHRLMAEIDLITKQILELTQ